MEIIDFGIDWKNFHAVGLHGSLEDFSSETLHVHPFHQVLHIKNGIALLQDNKGTRPQYGHMAVFIPDSVPHRTVVIGDTLAYQSLYFRKSLLNWHGRTFVLFQMSSLGLALLQRISKEEPLQNLDQGIAKDYVDLFLKILPTELKNESPSLVLPESHTDICRRTCRFIEQNYREKITSEDISRAVSLSFRQISRAFKADMGLTVFEYLRIYRMLQASIAINMTRNKIISVAYDCGYDSISSFFIDFKKLFGISPAEFRNRHQ
ncbi:MAG: AraC family transcriptional regulator [Syntrophaceae bacterium]